MLKTVPPELWTRIEQRFHRLYGDRAESCMQRLAMMVGRYGIGENGGTRNGGWSQKDAVLITYGDSICSAEYTPLQTLHQFMQDHLQGQINTVHILPFFPYSSDDGFSVIDYRKVNPQLGSWKDVAQLNQDFELMFDLVINHVSRKSGWYRDFLKGIAPGANYFITVDPKTDLSQVTRPRSLPLLTPAETPKGKKHVWTTFSADQIDLNFSNPDVLFEYLDILFFYIYRGARIIRLDAIAYLWKEIGTSCIHRPEAHEVVKLLRDCVSLVDSRIIILTETNVPHKENISYFGEGDEAHMVYQFALPPLLLHALLRGDSTALTRWAQCLGQIPPHCTYFNFTASHDGIGVRPLEGLVPPEEVQFVIESVTVRGGRVSYKDNPDGSQSPYELNITYYDALSDPEQSTDTHHAARFMCSQAIALSLIGIPGIYLHSLTATNNDAVGLETLGYNRAINRKKWSREQLEGLLADPETASARVLSQYKHLLAIRAAETAFHPESEQTILSLNPQVFALLRTPGFEPRRKILALFNLTAAAIHVDAKDTVKATKYLYTKLVDLITGETFDAANSIPLGPYQFRWLVNRRAH